MPKISGIDFLKVISPQPQVILTTAFPDYALESYEFAVVDYLLKPYSFQRFVKAMAKVRTQPASPLIPLTANNPLKGHEIFIKSGYEHIKINLKDITYIKSEADYTEIVIPGKKYLSSEPLREWLDQLDQNQFVRIHKSYIINISKIERIAGNQIYLEGNIAVPIGRTFKDEFVKRFINKSH